LELQLMRFPVAVAALVLLATPAAAQRLNTTRVDVRDTAASTMCGFQAYPEMTLVDDTKTGNGKSAVWIGGASGDPHAEMRLIWGPAARNWRTPPFLAVGFVIATDARLNRDSASGASLVIDGGKPIPLLYNTSGDRLIFVANRDTDNVGARVIGSDDVVLEVLDFAGTSLRRYTWDTRRLGDAVETVSVVGWGCSTP
jgi:hypothetical protein